MQGQERWIGNQYWVRNYFLGAVKDLRLGWSYDGIIIIKANSCVITALSKSGP